jgi:ABC-2 type transport system ATP-binding protein
MSAEWAVSVQNIVHRYGARLALRGVSLQVAGGELFGLLGPNGCGKTTLFRILATSLPPSDGQAQVFGLDVVQQAPRVRRTIGVVFQSPSLDKKLTAAENLMHHGHLYGLRGLRLRERIREVFDAIGLADRADDRVEQLSGGMQRRVEVAKGLLHQPRLMIMDEPSTGLDPGARRDMWTYLAQVRDRDNLAILLTTHLMDEADRFDRVAILNRGELVAIGTPGELAAEVGGEVVTLQASDPRGLAGRIQGQLGLACTVIENTVRIEQERGHELVAMLFDSFPGEIITVTVRRPTLEDVFLRKTGHGYRADGELPLKTAE